VVPYPGEGEGSNVDGKYESPPRRFKRYRASRMPHSLAAARNARESVEATFVKRTHPELKHTTVRCSSCERTFVTRSTRSEIVVDVCSNCHPAYTGVERHNQTGSRIERFERRRAASRRPVAA